MHMYTGLDGTDRAAKINDCACNIYSLVAYACGEG